MSGAQGTIDLGTSATYRRWCPARSEWGSGSCTPGPGNGPDVRVTVRSPLARASGRSSRWSGRRACWVPFAVPEAAPKALGARGSEERSLGFGDPHGRSLAEWVGESPVLPVSEEAWGYGSCRVPPQGPARPPRLPSQWWWFVGLLEGASEGRRPRGLHLMPSPGGLA